MTIKNDEVEQTLEKLYLNESKEIVIEQIDAEKIEKEDEKDVEDVKEDDEDVMRSWEKQRDEEIANKSDVWDKDWEEDVEEGTVGGAALGAAAGGAIGALAGKGLKGKIKGAVGGAAAGGVAGGVYGALRAAKARASGAPNAVMSKTAPGVVVGLKKNPNVMSKTDPNLIVGRREAVEPKEEKPEEVKDIDKKDVEEEGVIGAVGGGIIGASTPIGAIAGSAVGHYAQRALKKVTATESVTDVIERLIQKEMERPEKKVE